MQATTSESTSNQPSALDHWTSPIADVGTGSSSDELTYDVPGPLTLEQHLDDMPELHLSLVVFPWVDGDERPIVPATPDMTQIIDEYDSSFPYTPLAFIDQPIQNPHPGEMDPGAQPFQACIQISFDPHSQDDSQWPADGEDSSIPNAVNASQAFTNDENHQPIDQHPGILQIQIENITTQPPSLQISSVSDSQDDHPWGIDSSIPYQLEGSATSHIVTMMDGLEHLPHSVHGNDGQWADDGSQYPYFSQ